jgi:serine protease AprX
MKKNFIVALIMVLALQGFSQISPDKYYIQFTDKNDSPFSLSNPSEYLSQKAIDRRARHGIAISEQDFPVNPSYINGVAATGAEIINPSKWLNGVTIYTTEQAVLDAISALPYVANILKAKPRLNIEFSEKPYFKNESYYTSSNVLLAKSTGELDYGLAYNQIHQLRGDELHNLGFKGQGMVIAVLDAGFYGVDNHFAFDSLFANNRILGTKDFVAHSGTVYDYHTHGTAVLSTMGANVPGQMIGTAPSASYWLLRSEDGDSETLIEEYNWVSAAEYADSVGVDVINSSLGYTTFDDPATDHTYEDMNGNTAAITIGADIAASKGILVVNSAGNSGGDPWNYIGAPADGFDVFTIGAVDADGILASFSSRGPTADGRIKPNVCAQGSGTVVVDPFGSFTYSGGTSFSSPIIAGMSACLWQNSLNRSNLEIMEALMKNGNYSDNPNNDYGWGIPDYYSANSLLTVIDKSVVARLTIDIFPNPVIDQLTIKSELLSENSIVRIFTQGGRLIKECQISGTGNSGEFLISGLDRISAGVYTIQLIHGKSVATGKFIK